MQKLRSMRKIWIQICIDKTGSLVIGIAEDSVDTSYYIGRFRDGWGLAGEEDPSEGEIASEIDFEDLEATFDTQLSSTHNHYNVMLKPQCFPFPRQRPLLLRRLQMRPLREASLHSRLPGAYGDLPR